ncbi:RNA-directed DNA polymerase from mobile element jockey [Eumeta japonica]|uniref:RNA-directed DNA polymerase from mobile element jockey n=1 Tax=Eumeta variegata TaxID=151549 RepID=A0A4C1V2R3_EUMVA|nr:RNA-directed DNA polymerase from mobile element jockey [Eumeta japonica]
MASGIDGFTSDICQVAIFWDLRLFLAVANKCLELGYFPRAWKVDAIKVIPKPGKDVYTYPKSYRLIRLLPVLNKTVERMLIGRLQCHIMLNLQMTQYGFTPQGGTEDALYDLMTYIYNDLNLKKIILMVSLGIEGAFNNAWWAALKTQLLVNKCPVNLYSLTIYILSQIYIRDRANCVVGLVRLSTSDQEDRCAKGARRCTAQYRSKSMPGSSSGLPPFRADLLEAAPSRY